MNENSSNNVNPWLGLSSYTEDSLKLYQFNGRDEATITLSSMIQHNLFVTLYGRSGIGKTSLLRAGVFPVLKTAGFTPITIRLNELNDSTPLSAIVWQRITEVLKTGGYDYISWDEEDSYKPDFNDIAVLRKLFASGHFANKSKREDAIPVIVFDQFEEILYESPAKAQLLIKQLYALIDDSYDFKILHETWKDYPNFRIVLSIREDDLYLLEDFVDTFNYTDLKSNRYRLLPMSDNEAIQVVLNPTFGKGILESGHEREIAERIVALSKTNGQTINTLLLSLLCYVQFNECVVNRHRSITMADLEQNQDILVTYYKEATKGLPKTQLYYLEDRLVDNQGRRTSIYIKDLSKYAPQVKDYIEKNTNQRLFHVSQERVEFIHDQLAAAVFELRTKRKSRNTKRIGVTILVSVLLITFLYSFSQLSSFRLPGIVRTEYANEPFLSEITIDNPGKFHVIDCPSLKTITINNPYDTLEIIHCPSLTSINYTSDFAGKISVFGCQNLKADDIYNIQLLQEDSIYLTQYPYTKWYIDNVNKSPNLYHKYFKYDSINNRLVSIELPIYIDYHKFPTCIPDSLKYKTDLFVPFGYKEHYIHLREYQPFKSINELPLYYTWQSNLKGMINFFFQFKGQLLLSILCLLIIQCFFWSLAYSKYRLSDCNGIKKVTSSFFYGIGMTSLGLLAFMAGYWGCFNLLRLSQPVSSIIGGAICITCLTIVYKNSFYALKNLINEYGFKGLMKKLVNSIIQPLRSL